MFAAVADAARQNAEVTSLELCGGTLHVADPEQLLAQYTDPTAGYAWPEYDTLVTNGGVEIVTGDLLAPTLLEDHVDRTRFRALVEMLPRLSAVAELPRAPLESADNATVDAVAALFGVLDDDRYARRGVRGTIVSKVLHRKRPDLIPIYDSRILAAYTAPGAIESQAQERTWVAFLTVLCQQMRADLQRESVRFAELETFCAARGASITRLRILDILVWMTISTWQ
jgi:hypothetical protein